MTIATRFNLGDRVCWDSEDYGRILTGFIKQMDIEVTDSEMNVLCTLECDEEIKQSRTHFLHDTAIFPEAYKQKLSQSLYEGNDHTDHLNQLNRYGSSRKEDE